jgi:hypothetical protein
MPKRGRSSYPSTVYVVVQRASEFGPRGGTHDVSCVSVHTTLSAANRAAKSFFDIGDDEDVETEAGWCSWEDLDGTRVQTDSEGKVRVIRVFDTQEEDLVWVEEKNIEEDSGTDESESDESGDDDDEQERQVNSNKRIKVEVVFSSPARHFLMYLDRPQFLQRGVGSNRRLIQLPSLQSLLQ